MQIRLIPESEAVRWDAYVDGHPSGLAYHLYPWMLAIRRAYRFETYALAAEENGRLVGILPLAHLHWPLQRGQLISLPYCDAAGPLADTPSIADALLRTGMQLARQQGAARLSVRWPTDATDMQTDPGSPPKVRMLLSLPPSADELLVSYSRKIRYQIRKAGRDGLEVRIGGAELLDRFYPIFATRMHALGSPVHSKRWLAAVMDSYGSGARLGIVTMPDGQDAAGAIVLGRRGVVSNPWSASLTRYNRWNANTLLYWHFLAEACERGFQTFDFGRCTPGEGVYYFKAKWDARPYPLRWSCYPCHLETSHRSIDDAQPGGTSPQRRMAAAVISRLPLAVATRFGSAIRRFIDL